MKKLLALLLALCMALTLCVPALASSGEPSGSGEASEDYAPLRLENAVWALDEAAGAWCLTGVSYCLDPAAPEIQTVNIYVPAAYLDEAGHVTARVVNGYNAATAPIILANDIGGYAQSRPTSAARCAEVGFDWA